LSIETNKATVRRCLEQVIGEGRAYLVEEFLAEGIELHGTGLAPGMAKIEEWLTMLAAAFPDRQLTIDDMVAEGDRVVARITVTGKHLGAIQGIPATGRSISQPCITIFRMANARIAEGWFAADNLSIMQQLGVIPAPRISREL
jgi:steroid delta-isomerase-like uncharacterized protein